RSGWQPLQQCLRDLSEVSTNRFLLPRGRNWKNGEREQPITGKSNHHRHPMSVRSGKRCYRTGTLTPSLSMALTERCEIAGASQFGIAVPHQTAHVERWWPPNPLNNLGENQTIRST